MPGSKLRPSYIFLSFRNTRDVFLRCISPRVCKKIVPGQQDYSCMPSLASTTVCHPFGEVTRCVHNGIKHPYGRPAQRMVNGCWSATWRTLTYHQSLRGRYHYALAERNTRERRRKRKDLLETIELAISIILNPEEPPPEGASIVKLKHLPQFILVKLNRTRATRLDALDDGVIQIFPSARCKLLWRGKRKR